MEIKRNLKEGMKIIMRKCSYEGGMTNCDFTFDHLPCYGRVVTLIPRRESRNFKGTVDDITKFGFLNKDFMETDCYLNLDGEYDVFTLGGEREEIE